MGPGCFLCFVHIDSCGIFVFGALYPTFLPGIDLVGNGVLVQYGNEALAAALQFNTGY
jgi:hypothetical protein